MIKVTVNATKSTVKHKPGSVYSAPTGGIYLVLLIEAHKYAFVSLGGTSIHITPARYTSLEEMDKREPNDIEMDAELIINNFYREI
jgi:hypothetical protein